MISKTKNACCHACESEDIVRNGFDYKGDQKFHCISCGYWGTLEPQQGYSPERKEEILRAYQERQSMRGIERTFGVARSTLAYWLEDLAEVLPTIEETLAKPQKGDVLELDELWSYVFQKKDKRWIWLAICRRTRQVVAYFIGDRSEESCKGLWERIPKKYRKCPTFSDFWESYSNVFPKNTSVGKESGETNHVERFNNTLRQRLGRLVRKTLSFSKSDFFHEVTLWLFLVNYNLWVIS